MMNGLILFMTYIYKPANATATYKREVYDTIRVVATADTTGLRWIPMTTDLSIIS